jgi:phage major head subunit gpT-like protein
MTFTELEYVLMLACAVLLWRASVANRRADIESDRANRYAAFLTDLYEGRGSVVKDDEGRYMFKHKETNQ